MDYLKEYAGKTVLVTGGAGLIGSNLVRRLVELEVKKVFILDSFVSAVRWNILQHPRVVLVEGDVADEVLLKRIYFERPDYVFHLAAHFANQKAVDYPEENLRVNALGTMKLLEYSRLSDVKRFVFASSGCSAYGSRAPVPLKEDFVTLHLDTPYQIHKLLGELYCNFFMDHWGLPTVRLRLFNVYGPCGLPGKYKNVIPNFMHMAHQGKPLTVMGTGQETRDFTFVGDLVDGLLRGGTIPEAVGEEMNLGSGVETPSIDLANLVNKVSGNAAGTLSIEKRDWDHGSRRLASIDKARNVMGYDPQTKLEDGLKKTNEWFVENKEKVVYLET
ncbi:MAG: NAD-dependent epimerase/dehydratase family protein [Chloroflexi bacterium]|jgi:UDP-glucose 4-epimerase|nr:NAD-dependent epimerase/dehydratase family protein [Chloroflexota bacterium]